MPGLSHALVPAQESKRWSFGHLLLLPVIQKGLFLGPKKARKIRHANTGLPSSSYEFVCGGQTSVTVPPLRFTSFWSFCGFRLFDSCGFFVGCLGRALLLLFCFCVFSGRGGRSPVEPWTRLHCSELYWRCPVVLPAVQSGAPSCSKACQDGSVR